MRKLNVTGERYGRLLAVHFVPMPTRHTHWLFLCDCGVEKVIKLDAVRRGLSQSCGCRVAEVTAARSLKHGHSVGRKRTAELRSYTGAKSRCNNPNDHKYPIYGGRGIRMCERWMNSVSAFLADMGPRPPGKTLERKDVNGDYCPENCEWATNAEQSRNRRNNVVVEHEGRRMILKDYAALMGVNYKALHARVKYKKQVPAEAAKRLQEEDGQR